MTIIKLRLVEDLGRRFENTHETLHVNKEVAIKYAEEAIAKGFEITHDCGEWGVVKTHHNYKEKYELIEVFVNE